MVEEVWLRLATNSIDNYAAPHSSLFMIERGVERALYFMSCASLRADLPNESSVVATVVKRCAHFHMSERVHPLCARGETGASTGHFLQSSGSITVIYINGAD